jgi:hypothetical protein
MKLNVSFWRMFVIFKTIIFIYDSLANREIWPADNIDAHILRYINAWVSVCVFSANRQKNHKKISMALITIIQVLYDLSKEILKVDLLFVVMATNT